MNYEAIKKLFDKFNAPLEREDVWSVQSATVIKHKALEKLAACARISFEKPEILRAERDEAVILVHGMMPGLVADGGGREEWSIGEALVNTNYRVTGKMAAYVYAMAEKRAKDRVILKLAGLHGLYSEDEADEFKESSSAPQQGRSAAGNPPPGSSHKPAPAATLSADAQIAKIKKFDLVSEMFAWSRTPLVEGAFLALPKEEQERVSAAFNQRQADLEANISSEAA